MIVMARIYLAPEQLEESILFYERVLGQACNLRFVYPEGEIELASIGSLILIAGQEVVLMKMRDVALTIIVDSLRDCRDNLLSEGATLLDGPTTVPTGMNMHMLHPDGAVVEYVEIHEQQRAAVRLLRYE